MNFAPSVGFFRGFDSLLLTYAILHFVWQGVVITSLLVVATPLLRRQSPRMRYGVSVVALLLMLACLPANYIVLRTAIEPLDHVFGNSSPIQIAQGSDTIVPPSSSALNDSVETTKGMGASFQWSLVEKWAPFVSAGYATGVLLMTLRLACSTLGVLRLRALSIMVTNSRLIAILGRLCSEVGLRTEPALATCEKVAVPVVVGILKPVILMPPAIATGMTSNELEAILLHELAHIRRGDLLVNFLQRIAESFLFFHPGVWYVSRLIASEREDCCDDIVLSKSDRQDYASALIRLAESCTERSRELAPVAALAATGADPSQLKRRVMRVLRVTSPLRFDKPGVGFLMTFLVALSIAAFNVHAQSDPHDSSAKVEQNEGDKEDIADAEPANQAATLRGDDDASFIGPVQIERVGEVVVVRGAKKDVERLEDVIAAIEKSLPASTSIKPEGELPRIPVHIERLDDGQLIIEGETEQDVEAIEHVLREVFQDLGVAREPSTARNEPTLRILALIGEAKPSLVTVALDAYLEGKGIDKKDLRYQFRKNNAEDELVLYSRDDHYRLISAFLKKREWIADNETDSDGYALDSPSLRLSFHQAPWSDVLNWIAEHTKSSISLDHTPRGTFSYEDSSRMYSPSEAFDAINEALFRKGYSLVRRNKMIHILDLEKDKDGKLVRDLLAETPLADLDTRGDFELTKCRFEVGSKHMVRIQADIKQLLGKHGSLVVLPESKQFSVVDIGRNLRVISGVIRDHAAIDR